MKVTDKDVAYVAGLGNLELTAEESARMVETLREHPILNSTWRDGQIVLKRRINLGVAVALEEGPSAVGPDPVRDQRARRVAEGRDDDDDPEAPWRVGDRLEVGRIGDEEPGERQDELRRDRDHRRLEGHGEEDARVPERAVERRQERDDDLIDEGEHGSSSSGHEPGGPDRRANDAARRQDSRLSSVP